MMFTREELAQFQELISEEYGVKLTIRQARIHATVLLTIIGILLELYFAFRLLFGADMK
jgi:hypothetical protein